MFGNNGTYYNEYKEQYAKEQERAAIRARVHAEYAVAEKTRKEVEQRARNEAEAKLRDERSRTPGTDEYRQRIARERYAEQQKVEQTKQAEIHRKAQEAKAMVQQRQREAEATAKKAFLIIADKFNRRLYTVDEPTFLDPVTKPFEPSTGKKVTSFESEIIRRFIRRINLLTMDPHEATNLWSDITREILADSMVEPRDVFRWSSMSIPNFQAYHFCFVQYKKAPKAFETLRADEAAFAQKVYSYYANWENAITNRPSKPRCVGFPLS